MEWDTVQASLSESHYYSGLGLKLGLCTAEVLLWRVSPYHNDYNQLIFVQESSFAFIFNQDLHHSNVCLFIFNLQMQDVNEIKFLGFGF